MTVEQIIRAHVGTLRLGQRATIDGFDGIITALALEDATKPASSVRIEITHRRLGSRTFRQAFHDQVLSIGIPIEPITAELRQAVEEELAYHHTTPAITHAITSGLKNDHHTRQILAELHARQLQSN